MERRTKSGNRGGSPRFSAVPASYLNQVLELGRGWGLSDSQMLTGTGIQAEALREPAARMPVEQAGRLALNAMRLGQRPGFGFELGLHLKYTSHGQLGYAVLSAGTLREALELVNHYARTRWGAVKLEFAPAGEMAEVRVVENVPLGPFRTAVLEAMLVLLWRHGSFVLGVNGSAGELCFEWAEPPYFAAYRERLPAVSWRRPANMIRFPLKDFDQGLVSADALASRQALREVEREMSLLGEAGDNLVDRVRAELRSHERGFPDLDQVAARLHLSSRTLKRKLQASGTSFQVLLNEVKRQEALHLMQHSGLKLHEIAARLGYDDPACFTRAFQRWTGQSPSSARQKAGS
ncbi:MAG: AraC family transcriptional regulator [Nevskia sp.]|nr:AraC family transcriptional regulator [Nevskia sp.]